MATQIQLRRDTAANWTAGNPTLAAGEPGVETDTNRVKVGDGASAWSTLAYQDELAPVQSVAGKTGAVTLDGADVGLGNVDDTADADKPVSTAQQAALDAKLAVAAGITIVDAGSDLSTARPAGAAVVYWMFAAGVDVGTAGANVTNGQAGDLYFVAS